jgi:3-oxoacyl-[acyl-carrier protein] reductase
VAVVTGAGRGIGRAIAERYAAEARACASSTSTGDSAKAVADAIGGVAVTADVGRAEDVDRIVSTTLDAYGRLDVMLNNAGIVRDAVRHVLEADEAWWDAILTANLKGHFLCSLAAAKVMARSGGGTIITMSSGGASRAHRGMVAYDASKGGIEAIDPRARARPGAVRDPRRRARARADRAQPRGDATPEAVAKTDATVPLGRAGLPADLAGPAVFLASDDAAYMTGSFVTVDGGVLFQQRSPQVETFPLDRFPTAP